MAEVALVVAVGAVGRRDDVATCVFVRAHHGELVVLCVVEEQVGGGVVAKGEVAEAHHGRVEQRQNGEGHAHRLAEAAATR
eukprot:80904-Pleurochrysis_carterae.AAC.1